MTVLKELLFSLVYYFVVNISILKRRGKDMNHLLKGAATTGIILIVSIAISVFCNIKDIHLDIAISGPTLAVCSMLIYNGWIKNEKNKDNQE